MAETLCNRCLFLSLLYLAGFFCDATGTKMIKECPMIVHNDNATVEDKPVVRPSDMTPVSVNLAFVVSLKTESKYFGGAFFLAVDDLNAEAKSQGIPVNFSWTFHNTNNTEASTMKVMADLYCQNNISAFVGPDHFCKSAGLMATAYSIPYMTFNCADGQNDTGLFLMVNTQFNFGYSALYLVQVIRHFGWTSAYLISGTTFRWRNTASLLLEEMHRAHIFVNGDTKDELNNVYSPTLENTTGYSNFFENTRDLTRVYIFLGHFESLILFARQLKEIPHSEEYVILAADDSGADLSQDNFYKTFHEKHTIKIPPDADKAFHNVLILTPVVHRDDRQEDFEKRVYQRDLEHPLHLPTPPPILSNVAVKIPSHAYPLYDATILYGRAVMALMATPGMDPVNGTNIINWLRCREHDSISGKKLYINVDGRGEDTFILYGSASQDGIIQSRMWEVGNFIHNGSSVIYRHLNKVAWLNGEIPVSNLKCGFTGEICRSQESKTTENWIITCVVLAFLVICLIVGFILLQKYLNNKEYRKMRWKINEDEIEYPSAAEVKEMLTPARSRKRKISNNLLQSFYLAQNQEPDVISNGTLDQQQQQRATPVVMYRGNRVFEKWLVSKDLDLPRPLESQLRLLKDMSHENINEFKGACITPPYVRIITQFCPRRSLQDILQKDDLPLHDMFATSIVQDLIKGMSYIHESKLGFHGNLKSSNCLVDSRWTVQISDFGMGIMKPARVQQQDEEEVCPCKDLLWTAPELLPLHVCPSTNSDSSRNNSNSDPNLLGSQPTRSLLNHSTSNSSNTSNSGGRGSRKDSKFFSLTQGVRTPVNPGTQKGDVYSFAIILYELYGRAGPWGTTGASPRETVYSLLNQRSPTPRPDTACLRQLNCDDRVVKLIEACWDDNPDLRPDFKGGIHVKFQPIQQLLLSPNIIDNMLAKMEKYTDDLEAMVEERTDELRREKKMTDNLLLRMLPRSVAERLKRGQPVPAEQYEQVTIYFSDIVGFTEMSAHSTPMEVVDLLNDLYTCFDTIIEKFDVYKVETIGDAYMVVSGLPMRNGDRHAGEIASMALQLLDEIKKRQFKIRGSENNTLRIRIGIHSGPCCAGVVGKKMPRYCLFGDTINTASRLESTGEALKVHCSEDCKLILDKLGGYHLEQRGPTQMKGKGSLMTYFLISEDHIQRQRRISAIKKTDVPWRCVSASNIDYSGRYSQLSTHSIHGAVNNVGGIVRQRPGTGSNNLVSYSPLVAVKEMNSKSLTRITLPLLSSKASPQEPWRQDRRSYNVSMDNAIDSSWPGVSQSNIDSLYAHQHQLLHGEPCSPNSTSTELHLLPYTSTRSLGRHSSVMTPIAEDPRSGSATTEAQGKSGSDSGSVSIDSSTSLSQLSNPPRDRILSEPAPATNHPSNDGLLSHIKTNQPSNRHSTNCPGTSGLDPLNSSFDNDRSASEPRDWSCRKESAVFVEPHSSAHFTSTSSSFPSMRLNDDESLEPDSPFSPEPIPSETDSLLESSWASSNHPFTRIDSIPAKQTFNTCDHDLNDYDAGFPSTHEPNQSTLDTVQLHREHNFKNPVCFSNSKLIPNPEGVDASSSETML